MHRTLSNRGRFAVEAMVDLALQSRKGPVALSLIGERQKISRSYLQQLFGDLRRHALVRASRGPGGGYSLGRSSDEISIADILAAVDTPTRRARTGDGTAHGKTNDLWAGLRSKLLDYLDSVTLMELTDGQAAAPLPPKEAPLRRGFSPPPALRPSHPPPPNSVFALGAAWSK